MFLYTKRVVSLLITFCLADKPLLLALFLQKKFGFGTVYKIPNKKAVNWIISTKKGVNEFLTMIDGFLRTESKLAQINQNMVGFLFHQKVPNNSNILESWWLAGFTEAEGCFYIQILSPRLHRSTPEIRVQYKFGLKDNKILYQLKDKLGSSVYKRIHTSKNDVDSSEKNTSYYWSSTTFESAQKESIRFFLFL